MTEKQIESQILTWLNYQPGVFAFKVNTTGVYDPTKKCFRKITNPHVHRGTADIIGVKNGHFFAIEVKTPVAIKKKPTQHDHNQTAFLEKVKFCKGTATRVCSLQDVIDLMREIP